MSRLEGWFGGRPSAVRVLQAVTLLVLLTFPYTIGGFYVRLLATALIFSIFALSVDLVWGYGGILTAGHGAFFGLGAYVFGVLVTSVSVSGIDFLGLGLSVAIPAVVGLLVAGALFLQGIEDMNFTMITLVIAIIVQQVASSWRSVTGGYNGLIGIPSIDFGVVSELLFESPSTMFYYVVVLVVIGVYLLSRRIVTSSFGTSLVAIRENELKAQSLGYNTGVYKSIAFALSCGIAGFAGGLFASHAGFASPSLLGFVFSFEVLIWVLIGGRGTLIGPVVGAVFLTFFQNVVSGVFQFSWTLLMGVALIVIVLAVPGGMIQLADVVRRATR